MNQIAFIVWDFDGTLWQNEQVANKLKVAYKEYLQEFINKTISDEEFDYVSKRFQRWSQAVSSITKIPELDIEKTISGRLETSSLIKKDDSIVNLVSKLINNKHLVLTNSSYENTIKGLRKIGFRSKNEDNTIPYPFEKIFSRDKTGVLKPDPKAFKNVLTYTNKPKSKHLMVGDTYDVDIKPARNFGFKAVHINKFRSFYE